MRGRSSRREPKVESLESRWLLTGGIDPTFGDGGLLGGFAGSLVVQSDGKILASSGVVTRYHSDGSLDRTFGGDGTLETPIGASALALHGGKIYVGGNSNGMAVARYHMDGTIDTSFGDGGVARLNEFDSVDELGIAPDGTIYAGTTTIYIDPDWGFESSAAVVARFNADGSVDRGFADNGRHIDTFVKSGGLVAMAVGPDGRVVLGTTEFTNSEGWSGAYRLNLDGSQDQTFFTGSSGGFGGPFPFPSINDIAIESDGDVWVADDADVVRVRADGSSTTRILGQEAERDYYEMHHKVLLVAPDGKVLVASEKDLDDFSGAEELQIKRFHASGALDTSFGVGGTMRIDVGANHAVGSLAVLADRKVLAGISTNATGSGPPTHYLARLTTPENPPRPQSPFTGTPIGVTLHIEAENYDTGGEGVAYHDTNAGNQSGSYRSGEGVDVADITSAKVVGRAHEGEWLEYTINVPGSTSVLKPYWLEARYASPKNFKLQYFVDDQSVGEHQIFSTGSYSNYQSNSTRINMTGGRHILRVLIDTGGNDVANFDWFKFSAAQDQSPPTPARWVNPHPVFETALDLSWAGAMDDVAVAGYDILRNGQKIFFFQDDRRGYFTFTDAGLSPGTSYRYSVIAVDTSGNRAAAATVDVTTAGTPAGQSPFKGTPFAPNQTIEAEDFDNGGPGVSFSDSSSGNAGNTYRGTDVDVYGVPGASNAHVVGLTRPGEWMEYTVSVPEAGTYSFQVRYATPATTANYHLEVDGVNVTGTRNFARTGAYETYATATTNTFSLSAGTHVVRLFIGSTNAVGTAANIDWLRLNRQGTPPPPPPPPSGNGLTGTYFNNENFTGQVFTRTDSTINFDWMTGSPDSRIGADTFSVRWSGQIEAPTAGTYTFWAAADDRAKLIIDGVTVVNYIPGSTPNNGTINLGAGRHTIVYEYVEFGGNARAKLEWAGPGITRQVVPGSRLFT